MLILYDHLYSINDVDIIEDVVNGEIYLPIYKNGSSSLKNLSLQHSDRYKNVKLKEKDQELTNLTVFIREPIQRYMSGLLTQQKLFSFNFDLVMEKINSGYVPIFDKHTIPQFWWLLSLENKNIKFIFKDISELSNIKDIKHLNKRNSQLTELSNSVTDKINYYFTEDIILYNKFIGKTVKIKEIINEIKKEENFINDLKLWSNKINYWL